MQNPQIATMIAVSKEKRAHDTGIKSPTYNHTHIHTLQHSVHVDCVTKRSSHTQTANGKRPKPKKKPYPKPQV